MKLAACLVAGLFFANGVWAETLAEQYGWTPYVDLDGQLFPSYIIASSTVKVSEEDQEQAEEWLGDPYGLIGVTITSPKAGTKVKVTVKATSIFEESTYEAVLPEEGVDYNVMPTINYKYDALHRVKQQVPLNIAFDVSLNGGPAVEQSRTITLRSINDCMFLQVDPETQEVTDFTFMFGAYVNEDHPQIDQILREALDTGIVDSFDGYQDGKPEDVLLQVFAVWNVLQRRGFKYSDITTTVGASDRVASQHVRFVDQSLKTAQANCVDGSVLMASILRKIGLKVYLVIIPSHCFLAFDLTPDDADSRAGLETTMMGQDNLKQYDKVKGMSQEKADAMKTEKSWDTFSAAIDVGTDAYRENAEKFDDENETQYQLIDIDASREQGVMPIAYVE